MVQSFRLIPSKPWNIIIWTELHMVALSMVPGLLLFALSVFTTLFIKPALNLYPAPLKSDLVLLESEL